ncbi:FadR/GntR family transcriptional regulator [Ornithinimicrobium sufpigmenti]|uniref:FadR/GntR family transcriptional regulator n=1 Tax=Ornithinimicrobium sufpigmenti TaxID=2508882 RepID=UPI001035A20F|nr:MULTISPECIES: FadR/GntR family transcriptional regulator [unclassified Ornithinimicrobium]
MSANDDTTRVPTPAAATPRPTPLSRPRLYEQIVQELHHHIATHGLQPGDKLPAERELAQALGVSRASLAQALVALEVVGVVQVRHGEGATIRQLPGAGDTLLRAIREHQDALPDIIDARSAMEAKLAWLAAERRTEEDLRLIDEALAQMRSEVRAGQRALEGDRAFHEAVTRAAHSPVLARLMAEISELILESRTQSLSQPGRPQDSLRMHEKITDAIRRRDAGAAAAAMTEHIAVVSDVEFLSETPLTQQEA